MKAINIMAVTVDKFKVSMLENKEVKSSYYTSTITEDDINEFNKWLASDFYTEEQWLEELGKD